MYRKSGTTVRAFTLIELLVVIAVIAVILALFVGLLGGARKRAKTVPDIARMHHNVLAVQTYLGDYKEVFPISDSRTFVAADEWYVAIKEAGIFERLCDADPDGCKEIEWPRFSMSVAMVYSPAQMVPGATVPVSAAKSSAIQLAQVIFPSQKGLMLRGLTSWNEPSTGWCCGTPYSKGLIGGTDGAVREMKVPDCEGGDPLYVVDQIGVPVYSTWQGCKGIDWRK